MTPLSDSLEMKRAASLRLLRDLAGRLDPSEVAVAWTGGKDSTVALDLWRTVLAGRESGPGHGQARAISIDTGFKFPEIVAFRDGLARNWDLRLTVVRPRVDLASYPVARDKVACCLDLKVTPLKEALAQEGIRALITGVRRDEHPSREGRLPLEEREDPPCLEVNPLLDWTEMDVWAHTAEAGLPFCELYGQGYRSLGCMPCTVPPASEGGERDGRDPDKEAHLGVLRDLGYF